MLFIHIDQSFLHIRGDHGAEVYDFCRNRISGVKVSVFAGAEL